MLINFQNPPLQEFEKRGLVFRHCFSGSDNDGIDPYHPDQILRKLGNGSQPREGRPIGTGPRGRRGGMAQVSTDVDAAYVKPQQAPQNGLTAMLWIKPPTGGDVRSIFGAVSTSGSESVWAIQVFSGSNTLCQVYTSQANGGGNRGRYAPYTPASWTHAAMIWDGGTSDANVKVYINGIRADNLDGGGGGFPSINTASLAPVFGGFWSTHLTALSGGPNYPADDFRLYSRILDPSEIKMIWAAGYQPPPDVISYADAWSYELVIRPDADVSDGTWTDQAGGTSLFAAIDEPNQNDTDYIISAADPANDTCEVNLSDFTDTPAQPLRVHYRYWRRGSGGSMELRVRLLQGASQIASWTHSAISTTPVNAVQTLSGGEFASISDFTNLRLEFKANKT